MSFGSNCTFSEMGKGGMALLTVQNNNNNNNMKKNKQILKK